MEPTNEPAQVGQLTGNEKNPRRISQDDFKNLVQSIQKFGDLSGVIYNETTKRLVGGHQRVEAFKSIQGQAPIVITKRYDEPTPKGTVAIGYVTYDDEFYGYRVVRWEEGWEMAANVAANRISGEFNLDLLAQVDYELSQLENGEELLALSGQSEDEIKKLLASVGVGDEGEPEEHGSLTDAFLVPPFSVLDTKQGYWQTRRGAWMDMGIQSELGRSESLLTSEGGALNAINNGTSVFDPVLCEIMCRWFNVAGGTVLDPFAGGSVRGVVASKLGQKYVGVELRGDQVEANRAQAATICDADNQPVWVQGDSANLAALVGDDLQADLVFSCPPYADLEVYSKDPADLSNMPYEQFNAAYRAIIAAAAAKLKPNRFAAFVVGEVRGKNGAYYNFVGDTISAFKDAGLNYYNEMILVNSAGTLPIRAGRQFNASRKVGKQHQNVLVFYKGDLKTIGQNFPELDFSQLADEADEA